MDLSISPNEISKFVLSDNWPSYTLIYDDGNKRTASLNSITSSSNNFTCDIPLWRNQSTSKVEYLMTTLDNNVEVLKVSAHCDWTCTSPDVYTDVYFIDMKTCEYRSRSIHSDVDPESYQINRGLMANRRDGVDLFFTGFRDSFVLQYNYTTNTWGEPIAFSDLPEDLRDTWYVSFDRLGDSGNYLLNNNNDGQFNLVLATPSTSNDTSGLREIDFWDAPWPTVVSGQLVSTANGAISFCHYSKTPSTKVICTRLNKDLQKEYSYEFDLGYYAKFFGVYNLKSGGLLLLSGHCLKEIEYNCEKYRIESVLIQANEKNQIPDEVPLLEFSNLDCDDNYKTYLSFYEQKEKYSLENGTYGTCARFICRNSEYEEDWGIKFFVKCF